MARSYQKVNYALRPAKNIERKMICEALRQLSEFGLVETYRYIGFGSLYFSDFILFHKALNITSMISIEGETDSNLQKRFIFNRPFGCIDIRFGHSNSVLPTLDWNQDTIAWLDYDGKLDRCVLADVKTICSRAKEGSVLIVSVNAHPGFEFEKDNSGEERSRLDRLKELVGEEKIPIDISNKNLSSWKTAEAFRRIINNEIDETLTNRNGGLLGAEKLRYKQIFNFHYNDGVNMLTVGGIFFNQETEHKVDNCAFERLPFTRLKEEAFKIEIPYLTYRELRNLDNHLPIKTHLPKLDGVPDGDIRIYSEVYRFFPNFAEAEL